MKRRYDNNGYYGGKVCPRCGYPGCQIVHESTTTGGDYGVCKGLCGFMLLHNPVGLLCGLCGMKTKTTTRAYWACPSCGKKFKV